MANNYHFFNPGRLSRDQNTLLFEPKTGSKKYLPISDISAIYIHGHLDINSALLQFLGKAGIPIYFFSYYDHFAGSFQPKEYLQAGQVLIRQVEHHTRLPLRMALARLFVKGAYENFRRTMKYYASRDKPALEPLIQDIERLALGIETAQTIAELMGTEGNMRQTYYQGFDLICPSMPMSGRSRQPPQNEMNALISFGNSLCYAVCLSELYHTQLDPTISFLHEPGYRRFSLALDLAEIFKPILVDRTIFALVNKKMITASDFMPESNGIWLKEKGRRTFVQAWEERLKETIEHRALKRKLSYRRLIRLEGHKLVKHILGIQPYNPFRARW
jgi:CRISPR-associated protein Cas1